MKPPSPTFTFQNTSAVLRTPSSSNKPQLRSPTKRGGRWWDPLFRLLAARKNVLVSVWLLIFPFAFLTLQWRMHRVDVATTPEPSFLPPAVVTITRRSSTSVDFEDEIENSSKKNAAKTPPRIRSPSRKPSQKDHPTDSFNPAFHPVIPRSVYEPKSANPLQVMYIGRTQSDDTREDVILDALERSRYIRVSATFLYKNTAFYEQLLNSFDANQPAAVVVDWAALQRDCHVLHRILSYLNKHNNFLRDNKNAHLLLLDVTASTKVVTCSSEERLAEIVPSDRIRVAKRSIVEGRLWNYTKQWVEPGKLITNSNHDDDDDYDDNAGILHATGTVGEDFVSQLRMLDEANTNRTIDVSHFWQASSTGDSTQYYYSFLRRTVSAALHQIKQNVDERRDESTTTWLDKLGVGLSEDSTPQETESQGSDDDEEEAADVHLHIVLLAASKIVIISQNDEWEDHDDRLMEALATGAMVLSDTMVAPPAGIRNKTNIVFFDSAESLQRLLHYYLDPKNAEKRETIARHGLEYALGRHRSWHVLESLLFGKALTQSDKKPYTQEAPAKRKHKVEVKVVGHCLLMSC